MRTSRWLTYPIFIVSWIAYLAASLKIHHEMTPDELLRIFHVDSHNQVPEYEVVHVRSVTKRDTDFRKHVGLNAFGKKYLLKLQKNDNLLGRNNKVRVWLADTNTSHSTGVSLQELIQEDEIGALYQDFDNEAALLVNHDPADDALLMDGSIGGDLVIKPLPSIYRKKYKGLLMRSGSYDDELFMDEEDFHNAEILFSNKTKARIPRSEPGTESETHTGAHVVYKTKKLDSASDYTFMELDKPGTRKLQGGRFKRDAPSTIYPEILVIVDYDGYKLHGSDNVEVKKYFVSFWNGVDLRYKLLKGPKVRISIAGIIISRGRDATPYFEKNRVGRNAIDSTAALTDMGKYLFQERRLPVYDIAVAITKLDMCRREFPSEECNRGTAGFAYVGGACVVNKRLEKVNSVAIVEDTGGFSGIIVAAHEVGHLLGSVHDGSPPPSYLGGPGAQRCRWEDGYIMSDLRHTERGFKWSPCSIAQFNHFLNGETASCLYNSPHEDAVLPRVLPGKLLSLDAQCRMDRGTSACFKDDRVCAQLFCFDASSGYCVSYRPAAEGSPCGDGFNCLNGKCVADNENAIPDYSENIDTFLRRTDAAPASTPTKTVFTRSISSTFPVTTTASPAPITAFITHQPSTTTTVRSTTPAWWQITTKVTTTTTEGPPTRSPWWYQWPKSSSTEYNVQSSSEATVPSSTTSSTTPRPTEIWTTSPSTFTVTPSTPKTFGHPSNNFEEDCQDKISNIGGSMSCDDFLNRYGFQYCRHSYIAKNCCASQRRVCRSL